MRREAVCAAEAKIRRGDIRRKVIRKGAIESRQCRSAAGSGSAVPRGSAPSCQQSRMVRACQYRLGVRHRGPPAILIIKSSSSSRDQVLANELIRHRYSLTVYTGSRFLRAHFLGGVFLLDQNGGCANDPCVFKGQKPTFLSSLK